MRILNAMLVFTLLLVGLEYCIRNGREARDGGDECLYTDAAAVEEQKRKRETNLAIPALGKS